MTSTLLLLLLIKKLKEGRAFQATLLGLINLGLVQASIRTLIDDISFEIENNYHTIVKRAVFQLSMQILHVTNCGYHFLDFLNHNKSCQNQEKIPLVSLISTLMNSLEPLERPRKQYQSCKSVAIFRPDRPRPTQKQTDPTQVDFLT